VIWEPFVLALVLGIIVSAGLYFAYLWPSVEPGEDDPRPGDPALPAPAAPPQTTAVADDAAGSAS
jgi:hypothetical protein